jgi:uncharacterized delta-60 repeat protein/uncharacterized repeat protein (TIGR01451 family)
MTRRSALRSTLERLEDRTTPAAGSLDTSFNSTGTVTTPWSNSDSAAAVAIDAQGRIVVAGSTTIDTFPIGQTGVFAVLRYLPSGALDTSFNGTGKWSLNASNAGYGSAATGVAIDSHGRIVAGGFEYNGTDYDFAAVRLNPDGTLDTSFGTGGKMVTGVYVSARNIANAVAIDPQDRVILAGYSQVPGSDADFAVVRLTAAGALDTTFNTTGKLAYNVAGIAHDDRAYGVGVDSQGRIVAGGYVNNGTFSDNDFAVARFTPTGGIDTTFGNSGRTVTNIGYNDLAMGLAVDGQDRIVLGGYSNIISGSAFDFEAARYTPAGVLDTSFGIGGETRLDVTSGQSDYAQAVAIDPAGNIMMGGAANHGFAVARLTPNGTVDPTFGNNGSRITSFSPDDAFVDGVAVDQLGRVVAAGDTRNTVSSNEHIAVARYTGNQVAVSVAVSDGTTKVTPGATVTYTVTVLNGGPDAAQRVSVADAFPAGLTGVTFTSTPAGGATGNTASGSGNIANTLSLPAGASVTYTATGTVAGPAGSSLVNAATATVVGALDGSTADNTATDTDAVGTPPTITSAATTSFTAGTAGTFAVAATGSPTLTLTAAGLPAGVTLTDNGNGSATLTSTAAVAAGTYGFTITAANGFGTNATQTFTLKIGTPPQITSAATTSFTTGTVGPFLVTATGSPTPGLTAAGLPAGVTLTDNGNGSATLANTPAAAAGTYSFFITAANGFGSSSIQLFALKIGTPPAITSATAATFTAGTAGTFTVAATGSPTPGLTAAGLPAGVTLTDNGNGSASLASTAAAAAGTFSFTLIAANGFGSTTQTFTLTITAPLAQGKPLVVGGANGSAAVFVPDAVGEYPANPSATLAPFSGFAGQVRTAQADVDGDGTADTILVTGPGSPIRFAVVSGADNTTVLVAPTAPFAGSEDFTGGGFAAAADLDHDGKADWIITPDEGGGPRVTIFSLVNGTATVRANFFGIDDPAFRGGARAALGDVNHDGTPDLAVSAGFLGGPRTALFDGTTLFATPTRLVGDFFAFPGSDATTLRNGVFVAVGDVNGDGFADLIFGGGPGGAPRVFVLSGATVSGGNVDGAQAAPVANFFVAGNSSDRGGVRVAAKDADGDSRADLAVGSGEGSPAKVRVYLGKDFTTSAEPTTFQDLTVFGGAALPGGVFVG